MILLVWSLTAIGALILFNLLLARFIEALVPPQGRFIEVDGLRLHVVDTGAKPGQSGPPLVFVHGLLGQVRHFTFALAALFPERRVVLIDRPGSGYSQAAPSQSLRAQGAILAKAMAALGLDKPLVVGHSLGGAVSLALALDHPESLCGLALIAPMTLPVAFAPKVFENSTTQNRFARWLGAWTIGPILSFVNAGAALSAIFAPETPPLEFANRAGGLLAARPKTLISASRDIIGLPEEVPEQAKRYGQLSAPVGVLFGARDGVLDPKLHGETFCAGTPMAELKMVEGGHMLPLTQPKVVEAFIRARLPHNPS